MRAASSGPLKGSRRDGRRVAQLPACALILAAQQVLAGQHAFLIRAAQRRCATRPYRRCAIIQSDSAMPPRAPRNRTISCTEAERERLAPGVMRIGGPVSERDLAGQVVAGDIFTVAKHLPSGFVDLLILDPPYNIAKAFNGRIFRKRPADEYRRWFQELVDLLAPTMKPDATLYVCSDWSTSALIFPVLEASFHVRNRITWERDKGRGAKRNWKNNTEDIWFCTRSEEYYFDVDAVKLKRKVLAPYRAHGKPKDWSEEQDGKYRLTHPSNIWTDITVPFWSMPENTDHPTQKPEKLMAKLILASSKTGRLRIRSVARQRHHRGRRRKALTPLVRSRDRCRVPVPGTQAARRRQDRPVDPGLC